MAKRKMPSERISDLKRWLTSGRAQACGPLSAPELITVTGHTLIRRDVPLTMHQIRAVEDLVNAAIEEGWFTDG